MRVGGGRISALCLVALAGALGSGNAGGFPPRPHPTTCGGTVTTQGSVGGVAFVADAINVIDVNGKRHHARHL